MELLELNRAIEDAKAGYEMAKDKKEAAQYKAILYDLRAEKRELLNKEFRRN